jgi:hypothetical protein
MARERSDKAETRPERRGLLKALGLGLGAAAAPLAVAGPAVAKEDAATARKARYRETEHVKAFYRTNRY